MFNAALTAALAEAQLGRKPLIVVVTVTSIANVATSFAENLLAFSHKLAEKHGDIASLAIVETREAP
jgi:hypothetical protein